MLDGDLPQLDRHEGFLVTKLSPPCRPLPQTRIVVQNQILDTQEGAGAVVMLRETIWQHYPA